MKLSHLLQYKYRLVYIALAVAIICLIISDLTYIFLGLIYLFYIMKSHRDLFKIIIIVLLFYGCSYFYHQSRILETATQYNIEVLNVNQKDDYTMFLGEIDGILVNTYLSDRIDIRPGDLYSVEGELIEPINQTIPGNFQYNNYLKSKGIHYQLYVDEYRFESHRFNLGIIAYEIENYIDEYIPLSGAYIKTFILADKTDFDQTFIENVNQLGISHLFAVSGLHIGLLVLVLDKVLRSVIVNERKIYFTITSTLCLYMLITAFSPSVVRASLMYILLIINKTKKLGFSSIDILSMIFIVLLLVNPFYFLNVGFVLSFLVTACLLLSSAILKKYKGTHLLFMVGYVSFVITIPIILNLNYQINLLTLIFNIIFIYYMTYIILPISYLVFIVHYLDNLLFVFIAGFEELIVRFAQIELLVVSGAFSNGWYIMIFYIIIVYYMSIFNEKKLRRNVSILLYLFVMLAVHSNQFNPISSVNFLDVVGDSVVIVDRFDKCNILIDTGEYDKYDSVINYIKSKNIRRIDYLIITHFHSDHYGEMNDILNEFSVVNVLTPENVGNIVDKNVVCGNLNLYFYGLSTENQNENNNSIIMSLYIEEKHYLFTGDAEVEREMEFISKYRIDVDYLKVAHHGSNTSSEVSFIESVNPEEAFIMVHRNNKFGHPTDYIIDRYQERDILVFRTDNLGTIQVEYFFGFERKKYNKP